MAFASGRADHCRGATASLSLTPLLLAVTAFLACYLPARRALRIEPNVALRCE